MKFWKERHVDLGYGALGIALVNTDDDEIISLENEDGIIIREECDGYYSVKLSFEDAKQAFQEAIDWIDEQAQK